ncbi:MAG TPA: DUF4190 domain-containing protein [Abditibacteriaceae bacterium]|jgi:hypothetical protein
MNSGFPTPQGTSQETSQKASQEASVEVTSSEAISTETPSPSSVSSDNVDNADWISAALPPVPTTPQPTLPHSFTTSSPIPSPLPHPHAAPYQAPVAQPPHGQQGDGTGGLIPYKNPMALLGYYVSVFGLIPCAGLILGPAAIVMGIMGLKYNKANPHTKGVAHAWVAIVLGSIELLGHVVFFLMAVGNA